MRDLINRADAIDSVSRVCNKIIFNSKKEIYLDHKEVEIETVIECNKEIRKAISELMSGVVCGRCDYYNCGKCMLLDVSDLDESFFCAYGETDGEPNQ